MLDLATTSISHFFDCYTSEGSPSDLSWTREEGTQRFPTSIVGPYFLDGLNRTMLRMNLAPVEGVVMRLAGNSDTGIYVCTNHVISPMQSVSINITGGEQFLL